LIDGIWGKDKVKMLCSSSYAVHARRNEEFGISVTEYLKAGLIPIVPNEGGSMEVVNNPILTYHDNEEAAQILAHLLSDDVFRKKQLQHCFERAKMFSLQAYMERQKKVLDKIVNGGL
jgi:glycosyltransferase involved in cell wall biosynthesis